MPVEYGPNRVIGPGSGVWTDGGPDKQAWTLGEL
jgi:hypothetical protein